MVYQRVTNIDDRGAWQEGQPGEHCGPETATLTSFAPSVIVVSSVPYPTASCHDDIWRSILTYHQNNELR